MRHAGARSVLAFAVALAAGIAQAQSIEDVTWTGSSGVTVSGNSLTKTGGAGWNAGAMSTKVLESTGFVEFTATETNTQRACGLNKGSTSNTLAEIDFAIVLTASGALQIHQSGSNYFNGTYASGDRLRVEVAPGLVRYRKNGAVIYTSTLTPQFPLLVDTSLDTTNSTLTNVRLGTLGWIRDANVMVSGTTLTKTGSAGWNSGAISATSIEYGDGYVEFTATETNTNRRTGLSSGDSSVDPSDIDFGVDLKDDNSFGVFEAGISRGSFGAYASGDRFRVEVQAGTVSYVQNGTTFYTSTLAPQYPLLVDTALYNTGATLTDIKASSMLWSNPAGVAIAEATLTSNGSAGWVSGAASTASVASGSAYVEFTATETNTSRMCGLGTSDTAYHYSDIEFAISLSNTGAVAVYESGTLINSFGSYVAGDRFRVEAAGTTVKFRKNGVVFYTSTASATYPLSVDTSFDHIGGTLSNVTFGRYVWTSEAGGYVAGTGFVKTATTAWNNSGAVSATAIASGDVFVEFVASETNAYRVAGLSNGNTNTNYTEIDFAIWLDPFGSGQVYENGSARGPAIPYAVGDRFRIEGSGGGMHYRKNGMVFYTSLVAPTYPLLVDTALYSTNATLTGFFLAAAGDMNKVAPLTFSPAPATYDGPQTVAITTSTAGAEIRYTTDGSEPTGTSTLYSAGISISSTTTFKAKGFKAGMLPSDTSTATYTLFIHPPVFSHSTYTYNIPLSVTMTSATSGATIRYTTDGAEPTDTSTVYTTAVAVSAPLTLKAKAFKNGLNSTTTTAVYTFKAATPTFLPGGTTYDVDKLVTISSSSPGVILRYTTDGSEPTASSAQVTAPVSVAASMTLKAKAFRAAWQDSDTGSATYTMKVGTPTFSPVPGPYSATQSVVVSTVTSGATIHYTTNGIEPTEVDPVVVSSNTVFVDRSSTLKGKAWRLNWTTSNTKSGTYLLALGSAATPTIAPAGGTFTVPKTVSISSATSGSTIRYTLDGSDPTVTSAVYHAPFVIDWSIVVKARAFRTDLAGSPTASAIFSIDTGAVATPRLSPDGGVTTTKVTVTVTCDTPSAEIHYTTNGADPTEADATIVSGATLNVDRAQVVKARAWHATLAPSSIGRGDYIVTGAIAAGGSHYLALKADGTLWAWGANGAGQLGTGNTNPSSVPVQVAGLTDIVGIAAGNQHSIAVARNGTTWAFGLNGNGQLGNNSTTNSSSPVQVIGLSATAVSAGHYHSLAVGTDGKAYGWGRNDLGQLGDNTQVQRLTKVQVVGTTDIARVAAGMWHSVALKRDGTVLAWGQNSNGQVADGTGLGPRLTPVSVMTGGSAIAAGHYYSAFVTSGGAPSGTCWFAGVNGEGQFADGMQGVQQNSPVSGMGGVTDIAAGSYHTLFLMPDGFVRAAGAGWSGQLGDAGLLSRPWAVPVTSLSDVVAVSASGERSMSAAADGSVRVWGSGASGIPTVVPSFSLANNSWMTSDADGDRLTASAEYRLGSDPLNADTNADGIADGVAARTGRSATKPDMDDDGLSNSAEFLAGTDPFKPDTDGDGTLDGGDAFPLDATRFQMPAPDPADTTPPVITLVEPTNAILLP